MRNALSAKADGLNDSRHDQHEQEHERGSTGEHARYRVWVPRVLHTTEGPIPSEPYKTNNRNQAGRVEKSDPVHLERKRARHRISREARRIRTRFASDQQLDAGYRKSDGDDDARQSHVGNERRVGRGDFGHVLGTSISTVNPYLSTPSRHRVGKAPAVRVPPRSP